MEAAAEGDDALQNCYKLVVNRCSYMQTIPGNNYHFKVVMVDWA